MVERVRNIYKRDYKKSNRPLSEGEAGPPIKKKQKKSDILRRYPNITHSGPDLDNAESIEKHMKAISTELLQSKPRDTVLLPLMKSTFAGRRLFVLNDAVSVNQTLEIYPALSRPAVVIRH